MLENEAKGWHGSYSVIGRNIVERFILLLRKDEILSGNLKKVAVRDFFETEKKEQDEDSQHKKRKISKDIDIFSENYDKLKKEKLKIKEEEKKINQADICATVAKNEIKERYKYHQSRHEDINKLIIKKKKNERELVSYNPKMEFIWKKAKTGPQWKLLKGRDWITNNENYLIKGKKTKEKRKGKGKSEFHNSQIEISLDSKKYDSMNRQTKRGNLPTFYDFRLRTDKAFVPINKIKLKKMKKSNLSSEKNNDDNQYKSISQKKEQILKTPKKDKYIQKQFSENISKDHLRTYSNNFNKLKLNQTKKVVNEGSHSRNINSVINSTKNDMKVLNLKKKIENKNLTLSPIKIDKNIFNHTIDFSKVLPRDTSFFLSHNKNQTIHPIFNPSYKLIEPRSLTMVSYSKKIKARSTPKKFMGVDPNLYYDANKVINKINNHKEVNAPNFNIMAGRNWDSGPLPAFMVKKSDRISLETMTDKGLKMNNYANIDFHNNYSSFHPKKSFNKLVNYTIFKNDKEIVQEELKKINADIFGDKKIVKLIEKYTEEENKNKEYIGSNIDNFTFKTIRRRELNVKENKKPLKYLF